MKILIVDDNAESRYLLDSLLQGNGYDVVCAENGKIGLDSLKAGGIDLIISDILMPVMDGFDFCRTVKSDELLRNIPLIIYTATYTGPQDEAFARRIGADNFIVKPCEPDIFLKAVSEIMAADDLRQATDVEMPRESEMLKLYNERLVRKLEQKMLQLEKEVSARRETEETLKESERKYRLLAENTLDVIWTMNMDFVFTYVNPAISNLTGHTPEEWIGTRLTDHFDEENYHKIVKLIRHQKRLGSESAGGILETVVLTKDRRKIPIEIHGRLIFDENNTPTLLQGTTRDISESQKNEKLLRESEEKYRSILNNIEDGYYEVDLKGNLTFFNRSLCSIIGYPEAELKNLNYTAFMDEENSQKVFQTFNRVFSSGEPSRAHDWELVRKDGTRCHINNAVSLIRDAHGDPIGFRGILRDVSEHRKAERDKTRLTAQLQQAQKMEAIGTLAGGIAHDFNNLLSIILGYGEVALQTIDRGNPLREKLGQIIQAADRAKELTRQLLAYSRKQVLAVKIIDVKTVVTGFEKLLRRMIGEDINLDLIQTSLPLTVKADITQLEQVLMNLAVNARHAMPDGGTLTIRTALVDLDNAYTELKPDVQPGPYAMIEVCDTGCGIDKDALPRIFDPFFTTKGKDKGTGLGLATSYGIIKQHGGNIWAYSEPEQGTTFKVFLPISDNRVSAPISAPKKPENLKGSETVLLVEDNDQVRLLAGTILTNFGYSVLAARDGETALALLNDHTGPLDLVLTDMIMPGMNGRELFDRVLQRYPGIKSLYMSGYADDIISDHGMLDDNVNFIQKPFSVKTLAGKVRKVLDQKPGS